MLTNIVYIFLDIDGVLNNENYLIECYNKNGHHAMHMFNAPFDPKCLDNLMKLSQYLESKGLAPYLILSSTWRLTEVAIDILNARLAEYGLHITDCTEFINAERGKEIKDYLINHPRFGDYIIIDDEMFDIYKEHPKEKLINTDYRTGFDDNAYIKAIDYFERRYKE